jgi:hypothetical protein
MRILRVDMKSQKARLEPVPPKYQSLINGIQSDMDDSVPSITGCIFSPIFLVGEPIHIFVKKGERLFDK